MKAWVIYTLHDPRYPHLVRYVGKTHQVPRLRLKRHLRDARNRSNLHSARWVRSLLNEGTRPIMGIIEEGVGTGWEAAEKKWIAFYRAQNMPLTNILAGGQGRIEAKPSEQVLLQRRATMTALWQNSREEMCKALRRGWTDPESLEAARQAAFKRQADPSVQTKQRAAQKRSWTDSRIRENRIKAITQVNADPVVRIQHSRRTASMWADPEKRTKRIEAMKLGWAKKKTTT